MTGSPSGRAPATSLSRVDDRVLLATCAWFPEGEPGGDLLVAEFARRGVPAHWALWDDPTVDWNRGLVAVRATWDYDSRRDEFLAWAREVPRLLNGAAVFAWNTDKSYLTDLERIGLPVVPTIQAGRHELADALTAYPTSVVKPTVAANGRGVEVVRRGASYEPASVGPWIVQPLVESVRTEGETSVFVLGGRAVSQVRKVPGAGEIRVHEHLGGTTQPVPLDAEATDLAIRVV